MRIADWAQKLDHAMIFFSGMVPKSAKPSRGKPRTIPQPRLNAIDDRKRTQCRCTVNAELGPLIDRAHSESLSLRDADEISIELASLLVRVTSEVVGYNDPCTKRVSSRP